jgi:hypothetical protein
MSFPHLGDAGTPVILDIGRRLGRARAVCDKELGNAMKQYWCNVLNRDGRVNARETLEVSNDNEAFGKAQSYLIQNPSMRAAEVWLEDRYVGKIHSH